MKTLQAYGVFNPELRLANRSYFIVDKQGVIRYKQVMPKNTELLSNDVLLEELKKLN